MPHISILNGLIVLFISAFLHTAPKVCIQTNEYIKTQPGVVLTFDDNSVEEWTRADSVFREQAQWRVTFFVSKFQKISEDNRRALVALQSRGHEVGFHGDNHLSAVSYIDTTSFERYMQQEHAQVEVMKRYGLVVRSFAYPNGSRNSFTDSALLHSYTTLRGVTNKERAAQTFSCFYNGTTIVDGVGIEASYKYFSEEYLLGLLEYARLHNTIVILYGHKPLPVASKEKHEVDYQTLELICKYVKKNGMRFYTMSDLARLSTLKPN